MKRLVWVLMASWPCLIAAQQVIKVKREDNSFLFFQAKGRNDTIVRNKSDLFRIHFPDSMQHRLAVHLCNGQLVRSANDSLFRLVYIPGMKYSLSKPDTAYISLLEGICDTGKQISIDIRNLRTGSVIRHYTFLVN